ncbi:Hypothetical predicted protein, partial [Marmota monax]
MCLKTLRAPSLHHHGDVILIANNLKQLDHVGVLQDHQHLHFGEDWHVLHYQFQDFHCYLCPSE